MPAYMMATQVSLFLQNGEIFHIICSPRCKTVSPLISNVILTWDFTKMLQLSSFKGHLKVLVGQR